MDTPDTTTRRRGTHAPLFLGAALLTLLLLPALSKAAPKESRYTVAWTLYQLSPAEQEEARTDAPILAVLTLTPSEGWYTYAHNPGSIGKPTVLSATLEPGGTELRVLYPPGIERSDPLDRSKTYNAYSGATPFFVPIPEVRKSFTIKARLDMLLCSDTACLPTNEEFMFLGAGLDPATLSHPSSRSWWPLFVEASRRQVKEADRAQVRKKAGEALAPTRPPSDFRQVAEDWETPAEWVFKPRYHKPGLEVETMVSAILLGLLAGLLLNFMPCVLPVVCLKLSAFITVDREAEGEACGGRFHFREHNLFFAAGVLLYFALLSVILGFSGLAWGQMFQNSGVVLALTAIVFALSLSLFGLYDLPVIDLKRGDPRGKNPRVQALSTGFLATLLATPCSGPFLGGVLGWALMQPPHVIGAVFLAIGLGMALPYLTMAWFPGLVRFFPRPGPWTLYLERIVGFFLLGTCIYLINILPAEALLPTLVLLWLVGVAAWLWGMGGPAASTTKRVLVRILALSLVLGGTVHALAPPSQRAQWEEFSETSFTANLGEEPMLVDFTADWCPTCKVLESTVLTDSNLSRWKDRYGLTFLKADLTGPNPPALRLLRLLGSQSLPVVAYFPKGPGYDRPLVIRDLFTEAQIEEVLSSGSP